MLRAQQITYLCAIALALFGAVVPRIGPIRLVEILLPVLACWIFFAEGSLYLPQWRFLRIVLLVLPVYVLLIGLLGQLAAQAPAETFLGAYVPAVRVADYSLFFWLGYHLFVRRYRTYYLSLAVMTGVVIVDGLYGFVQFSAIHAGWPAMHALPYLATYQWIAGGETLVNYAATGFTGAVFTLAALGVMGITIGLSRWLSRHGAMWAAFAVFSYAVILSTERRSQLLAAGAVTLVLLAAARVRVTKRTAAGIAAILVLLAPFLLSNQMGILSPTLSSRLESIPAVAASLVLGTDTTDTVSNWTGRTEGTWSTYLDLAEDYPLGMGLYPPNVLGKGSDNSYLTYLVWGGPLLLLLYLLMLGAPLLRALSAQLAGSYGTRLDQVPYLVASGVLVSYLCTGVFGGGVLSLPSQAPLWIALAGMAAHERVAATNRKETAGSA